MASADDKASDALWRDCEKELECNGCGNFSIHEIRETLSLFKDLGLRQASITVISPGGRLWFVHELPWAKFQVYGFPVISVTLASGKSRDCVLTKCDLANPLLFNLRYEVPYDYWFEANGKGIPMATFAVDFQSVASDVRVEQWNDSCPKVHLSKRDGSRLAAARDVVLVNVCNTTPRFGVKPNGKPRRGFATNWATATVSAHMFCDTSAPTRLQYPAGAWPKLFISVGEFQRSTFCFFDPRADWFQKIEIEEAIRRYDEWCRAPLCIPGKAEPKMRFLINRSSETRAFAHSIFLTSTGMKVFHVFGEGVFAHCSCPTPSSFVFDNVGCGKYSV